jgi:hypothetical protein
VIGIGLLGAIPIAARATRAAGAAPALDTRLFDVLFRRTQGSLIGMFVTGVLMDLETAGAFHTHAWFRLSGVVFLFVGFCHARARVALRRGAAPGGDATRSLALVERWGWTMCAAVALLVVLMELKPFA